MPYTLVSREMTMWRAINHNSSRGCGPLMNPRNPERRGTRAAHDVGIGILYLHCQKLSCDDVGIGILYFIDQS